MEPLQIISYLIILLCGINAPDSESISEGLANLEIIADNLEALVLDEVNTSEGQELAGDESSTESDLPLIRSPQTEHGTLITRGTGGENVSQDRPDYQIPRSTPFGPSVSKVEKHSSQYKSVKLEAAIDSAPSTRVSKSNPKQPSEVYYRGEVYAKIVVRRSRNGNIHREGIRKDGTKVLLTPADWEPPTPTSEQLEKRIAAVETLKSKEAEWESNRGEYHKSKLQSKQERIAMQNWYWPLAPTSDNGLVFVNGYFRKDGTYVRPHFRSRPSR